VVCCGVLCCSVVRCVAFCCVALLCYRSIAPLSVTLSPYPSSFVLFPCVFSSFALWLRRKAATLCCELF
jgi:hypothetical protein